MNLLIMKGVGFFIFFIIVLSLGYGVGYCDCMYDNNIPEKKKGF